MRFCIFYFSEQVLCTFNLLWLKYFHLIVENTGKKVSYTLYFVHMLVFTSQFLYIRVITMIKLNCQDRYYKIFKHRIGNCQLIENLMEQTEKNFIRYARRDSQQMLKVKGLDEKITYNILEASKIDKVQKKKKRERERKRK